MLSLLLPLVGGLLGTAVAGNLKVSMVVASSSEAGGDGVSYEPENIADSKQSTVWVEGDDGSGLGAWVKLELEGEQEVKGLRLWNGNWYTHDFWDRHNRIKELEV